MPRLTDVYPSRVTSPRVQGMLRVGGLTNVVSGFLPTNLTGLLLWLKADAGTFQDTLYTVPATADGNPVGGWQDQSGNANHVTQAVAADRPTLKLNIQNGLPVLRYDGSDYLFRADTLGLTGSDKPLTAFVVTYATAPLGTRAQFGIGSSTNNTPYMYGAIIAADFRAQRKDDTGATVTVDVGAPAAATWYILSFVFSGTQISIYVNGAALAEGQAMNVGVLTVDRFCVGALLRIATANQHIGDIGEGVFYDSALSVASRQLVEQYLSSRWAIALP